jgi:hypothetical protein
VLGPGKETAGTDALSNPATLGAAHLEVSARDQEEEAMAMGSRTLRLGIKGAMPTGGFRTSGSERSGTGRWRTSIPARGRPLSEKVKLTHEGECQQGHRFAQKGFDASFAVMSDLNSFLQEGEKLSR